jgi:hypothetical protein
MTLSASLRDLLVCPKCKGGIVELDPYRLVCRPCALVYPVREGIPVMLVDEAEPLTAAG